MFYGSRSSHWRPNKSCRSQISLISLRYSWKLGWIYRQKTTEACNRWVWKQKMLGGVSRNDALWQQEMWFACKNVSLERIWTCQRLLAAAVVVVRVLALIVVLAFAVRGWDAQGLISRFVQRNGHGSDGCSRGRMVGEGDCLALAFDASCCCLIRCLR